MGLSSATLLALNQLPGGVPQGYLRVLSFNEDSVLVDQRTVQLRATALGNYDTLQTGPLVVQQDGYVSVYVGNESAADVYFDDVSIEHRQGLQVQENQYDPFGLDLAGVSGAAPGLRLKNFYQFNGKENQLDLGLNWNHQDWRFYDYQIGRWFSKDPLAEKYLPISPYVFVSDNPIRYSDPDGRTIVDGKGNPVTYERNEKTGKVIFSPNASKADKRIVNALLTSGVGTEQLDKLRTSDVKVHLLISSKESVSKEKSSLGAQQRGLTDRNSVKQADGTYKGTDATITIFQGSVNKTADAAGRDRDAVFAGTAGHEIEHATNAWNINAGMQNLRNGAKNDLEAGPNIIRNAIINQVEDGKKGQQ